MRNAFLAFIPFILLFVTSCKKDNKAVDIHEIAYEVTVASGGFSSISYFDEWEDQKFVDNIKENTWRISFKNKGDKRERMIMVLYEPNLHDQRTTAKFS